jgi:UrcA family protein
MATSKSVVRLGRAGNALACAALLFGAIGFSGANAAEEEVITVLGPRVKIVEHGPGTTIAREQVSVTASVQYDPVTLTTNSGVALLKDGVQQAARRVCLAADPGAPLDQKCVRNAINAAQPKIDAAVARAKANEHG